ncbi:hypothetical protein [Azospirillum halopraeferens]|uniref:hypothetical protein n=1 Tax=Azospirillum halopraeferens TaxID=34010 RepID=UPI0012EB16B5|nr:hypothetical protein [Azospirillum halopraeferens]
MKKRGANFNRYGLWLGNTWAHRVFKAHHTELNHWYWSFVPASEYCKHIVRKSGGVSPRSLFHVSGPNLRRVHDRPSEWTKHFNDFGNWARLSVIMSACSYLEMYIQSVVELALLSDPAVRHGKTRIIDGVHWVKVGIREDNTSLVNSCTKGEWPKRASNYKNIFGVVPEVINKNIGELESIRKFRNSVGHSFGRPLSRFRDPLVMSFDNTERISEKRMQRWLGLIDDIALSVDQHLVHHIGEFEAVWLFHRMDVSGETRGDGGRARPLSKKLGQMFSGGPGIGFCRQLVSYYDGL